MKRIMIALGALAAAGLAARTGGAAAPGSTVGMVLDVNGEVRWISGREGRPDLADELVAGDSLSLSPKGMLVLLYFSGCREETVRGKATVRVGTHASTVRGARPASRKVSCDPPRALLPPESGKMPMALSMMGPKKGPGEGDRHAELIAAPPPRHLSRAERLVKAARLENLGRFDDALEEYKELASVRRSSFLDVRMKTLQAIKASLALERWLRTGPPPTRTLKFWERKTAQGDVEAALEGAGLDAALTAAALWLPVRARVDRLTGLQSIAERLFVDPATGHLAADGQAALSSSDRALVEAENRDRDAILEGLHRAAPRSELKVLRALYPVVLEQSVSDR